MASSSNEKKQTLDLRYGPNPQCECPMKAQILVVETETKPSKGSLYYGCPIRKCRFFRCCRPERAIWSPSNIVVEFLGFQGLKDEVKDVDEVVSGVSRIAGSQGEEIMGNYVHFSWLICAILFTTLIAVLVGG
ncbi:hypothetical protein BUALT_Bualt16G0072000 [Buddleja alternifolia]|uniref:Zinc finger GRF-type domain-containing protein n=1 Tax=Buddleja alternifolia TaxID=168488 RepID=A0AAV6W7K4_9LAMI|nr:hypothetical protein BUALT_Bualt16G0072000 [Buddleja alternifolia]